MPEMKTTSKWFLFGPLQDSHILNAVFRQPWHRRNSAHWEIDLETHNKTTDILSLNKTETTTRKLMTNKQLFHTRQAVIFLLVSSGCQCEEFKNVIKMCLVKTKQANYYILLLLFHLGHLVLVNFCPSIKRSFKKQHFVFSQFELVLL